MGARPTDKRIGIVTDDGAKYVGRNISGARNPIYDPNPLPEVPSDFTFSEEQKRRAWNLMKPDHSK